MTGDTSPSGKTVHRLRLALRLAACGPLVGAATILVCMATYPGFDNATQFLSELGSAGAPRPDLFNTGIFITGLLAIIAGVAFALAIHRITGRYLVAVLSLACFGIGGFGILYSTLYAWPDPRHLAINLGLGVQLVPFALLAAFRRDPDMAALRRFLGLTLLLMVVFTLLTKHILFRGLVNPANVGWWERGFALILAGWVSVVAIALERRIDLMTRARPDSYLDLTPTA